MENSRAASTAIPYENIGEVGGSGQMTPQRTSAEAIILTSPEGHGYNGEESNGQGRTDEELHYYELARWKNLGNQPDLGPSEGHPQGVKTAHSSESSGVISSSSDEFQNNNAGNCRQSIYNELDPSLVTSPKNQEILLSSKDECSHLPNLRRKGHEVVEMDLIKKKPAKSPNIFTPFRGLFRPNGDKIATKEASLKTRVPPNVACTRFTDVGNNAACI